MVAIIRNQVRVYWNTLGSVLKKNERGAMTESITGVQAHELVHEIAEKDDGDESLDFPWIVPVVYGVEECLEAGHAEEDAGDGRADVERALRPVQAAHGRPTHRLRVRC
jgi:hypothetical protein